MKQALFASSTDQGQREAARGGHGAMIGRNACTKGIIVRRAPPDQSWRCAA